MLVAPLKEALFPVASPKSSFSEMALNHPRSPNIQSLDDQQPKAIEGMGNTVTIPPKKRYLSTKAAINSVVGRDAFLVPLRETMMLVKRANCDVNIVERGDGK
jgi:hypothetical protein